MMLRCGMGCTMDKQRAMVTFQQSAAQGHAGSMSCLGNPPPPFSVSSPPPPPPLLIVFFPANMFESGEGCSVDKFRAFDLYKKAKAGLAKENDGTATTRK